MALKAAAHKEPMRPDSFALGLGLTNECNLACAFCYRDPTRTDRLDLEQVRSVVESVPLRSVNLGTGENGLHPDFPAILAYLRQKPIKLTMTSNGRSVQILSDEDVKAFHELEFSLDYPNEAEQDAQRGTGNWALIHEQAARCRTLGVPVTFVAVMMRSNFDRLADIAGVAKTYGAPLRLNVYQAVRSDRFALSYEQYWTGFQLLFDRTDVLAIGEPLVRAMAGLPPREGGCGVATIRVTPRATVQPCVYWPGRGAPRFGNQACRGAPSGQIRQCLHDRGHGPLTRSQSWGESSLVGSLTFMTNATIAPDANVIPPIDTIAHRMPKTSAMIPAQSAPIA